MCVCVCVWRERDKDRMKGIAQLFYELIFRCLPRGRAHLVPSGVLFVQRGRGGQNLHRELKKVHITIDLGVGRQRVRCCCC